MDPGWYLITLTLLVQCFLVLVLVMPMPSNQVRTWTLKAVHAFWDLQPVRYFAALVGIVDAWYFFFTLKVMSERGPLFSPVDSPRTAEEAENMFRNERNMLITGGNLFFFLVLHRLLEIQDQLRKARAAAKSVDKVHKIVDDAKKDR